MGTDPRTGEKKMYPAKPATEVIKVLPLKTLKELAVVTASRFAATPGGAAKRDSYCDPAAAMLEGLERRPLRVAVRLTAAGLRRPREGPRP